MSKMQFSHMEFIFFLIFKIKKKNAYVGGYVFEEKKTNWFEGFVGMPQRVGIFLSPRGLCLVDLSQIPIYVILVCEKKSHYIMHYT